MATTPIEVENYLQPYGEFTAADFGEPPEPLINGWITKAQTDYPTRLEPYVVMRAACFVTDRFFRQLASEDDGDTAGSRLAEQYRYWQAKAEVAKAAFEQTGRTNVGTVPGPVIAGWS